MTFNSKSQIDVAILDFSKAFDTVPHAGLLGKLEHYGIDSKILLWITNFLNNRKQRVVVDGSFSNYDDVESGVPQGTVLGPLLFLLHINDLPSCVNSKVRLFADDCLLYGSKEESLLVVDPFGRKSNKYSSTHPQQPMF